jgi:hypothetical protein
MHKCKIYLHLWSFVNVQLVFCFQPPVCSNGQNQWNCGSRSDVSGVVYTPKWDVQVSKRRTTARCSMCRVQDVEALFLRQIGCSVGKQTRWQKVLLLVVLPFLLFSSCIIWQRSSALPCAFAVWDDQEPGRVVSGSLGCSGLSVCV